MLDINFVFFHVGNVEQPRLLVKSIRKFNPDSKIYFITDKVTENIDGVNETLRIECDRKNLMTSRLNAFSQLKLNENAIYMDTDVLLVRPITLDLFLEHDVYLCLRSHGKKNILNHQIKMLDLSEYENKELGVIYPYIACFTYTRNYLFWEDCLEILNSLDKKFHVWYGDQEALRIINDSKKYDIGYLDESSICNLPDFSSIGDGSYSLHFKGAARKEDMVKLAGFILSEEYSYPFPPT
jgi:hypothetical protein